MEILANTSDPYAYAIHNNIIYLTNDSLQPQDIYVRVHDGEYYSEIYVMQVAIDPSKPHQPAIYMHYEVSLAQDSQYTITQNDLNIYDPDSENFTVNAQAGQNYQVINGSTIVPNPSFVGVVVVPITQDYIMKKLFPFPVNYTMFSRGYLCQFFASQKSGDTR